MSKERIEQLKEQLREADRLADAGDEEARADAQAIYSKIQELQAVPDQGESEQSISPAVGATIGAGAVLPVIGAKAKLHHAVKGAEVLGDFQDFLKSQTNKQTPYYSEHGVGKGAVNNATHNVGQVLKNKVDLNALDVPGYSAPGNSLILQPDNLKPVQPPTPPPGQRLPPEWALMDKAKQKASLLDEQLNKTKFGKLEGPLIKSAAHSAVGLPIAGVNALEALDQADKGNYGSAAVSGTGALASGYASVAPALKKFPKARGIAQGIGALTAIPTVLKGVFGGPSEEKAAGGKVIGALGNLSKKISPALDELMTVYRGGNAKNATKSTDFPGVFVARDPKIAEQYGDVVSHQIPRSKVNALTLDINDPHARMMAMIGDDEAQQSLGYIADNFLKHKDGAQIFDEAAARVFMYPEQKHNNLLKAFGYNGMQLSPEHDLYLIDDLTKFK